MGKFFWWRQQKFRFSNADFPFWYSDLMHNFREIRQVNIKGWKMHFSQSDDTHLLALLREGSALAFKELYERYWLYVYRLALRKVSREDVAQEMAQQLFENLWDKREKLLINNVKAYLTRSLKNLIIDYIRRNILEENYLDQLKLYYEKHTDTGIDVFEYNELTGVVSSLLEKLPDKTRQVFILSRYEAYTIPEIAQQLNLSEKAIEYHLSKSLRYLREHLREFILFFLLLAHS